MAGTFTRRDPLSTIPSIQVGFGFQIFGNTSFGVGNSLRKTFSSFYEVKPNNPYRMRRSSFYTVKKRQKLLKNSFYTVISRDVKNLKLKLIDRTTNSVCITWEYDELAGITHFYGVYLNGIKVGETNAKFYILNDLYIDEVYRIEIKAQETSGEDYTLTQPTNYKNRAKLTWDASLNDNVKEYRIYTDNKTGTIDTSSPIAIINKDGIEIYRKDL